LILAPSLPILVALADTRFSPRINYRKSKFFVRRARFFCCFVLFVSTGLLYSQETSVQIKVRESRLFGLKSERFATFELAGRDTSAPLTSDNVNDGPYYYFLLKPVGNWALDADFLQEELPKLVILQDSQAFQIGWKTEVLIDSSGTSIRVGFSKALKIHQPFTVRFGLNGASSQAAVSIPTVYWPGYSALTKALSEAETASREKRYRDAIGLYERLLRSDSLRIFPQFNELEARRNECFQDIVYETLSAFVESATAQSTPLKVRISRIGQLTHQAQFVVDSLPLVPPTTAASDSAAKLIVEQANNILMKAKGTRDSLQQALDDLNVRWIIDGAATGKNGPQFQRMIEILTYAFSSVNFADTTLHVLRVSLPPDYRAALVKDSMQESFDIFVRQAGERFQERKPLFPGGFLNNLQKDTSSFSLPCYLMLKAVQDYFSGAFPAAMDEIQSIFRTCYDPELLRRFDQMRVFIKLRWRGLAPDVATLMSEASSADTAGEKDLAIDRYTAVLRLAPDFAYPAYLCGTLYLRTGDPIRARSFFERAYEIDSLYLSAYRGAWTLYQASGNYKGMIDVLTRAINSGNDFWETNITLGIAYLGDNDLPKAIKQFERALIFSPNNYQTNVQLGLAYEAAKDFQKARDYFNQAIFIDPHRMEAVEALQKLDDLQRLAH
jgi:tetratricopeptide (TPR) repeat protein